MCGFLGEVNDALLDKHSFKKLLDLSIRRGPDQQGFWTSRICQIGFNRLAILDVTENGNQPIMSPNGKFILVFNGEIYNYKELQHRYSIKESDLRSTSDGEILSHLIEKMPVKEFSKVLNGMFAITIWNIESEEVYLIRDFAGIKPLFYGLSKSGIVFASQFDQIFKHPNFKTIKLRPDIMKEFLGLGYMSAPNTVFENMYQVNPGQIIIWSYQTRAIKSKINYFNWSVNPSKLDSLKSTYQDFTKEMQHVVMNQLRSDVPIATFLSSGYDSSLVSTFAKQHKSNIKAFTYGISDSKLDESKHAKAYAKHLGITHVIEKDRKDDLLSNVDVHFKSISEPFGDYSSVPSFLITKKAKKYATVMLSGDGGDELFWGYPRFRKSLNQAHWFKYPIWLRQFLIPIFRVKDKNLSSALTVVKKFSDWILNKQTHFTGLDKLMPNYKFSKDLKQLYEINDTLDKPHVLQYLKKNEFYAHMQRTLRKIDLTSMANSLEVRVPFLDKQMIAFSNSIISEFTITHNRPKLILKDALYEYIPIEMVEKEKKGFTVPIKEWLMNDLKEDFIKTVINTPFYGEDYIDIPVLHTLVQDFYKSTRKVDPWGLWHLYAWQKWAIQNKLVKN